LTSSLRDGQTVSGTVTWTVSASSELSIDGTVRTTGTSYTWDTTKETDGAHTLRAGTLSFSVTVRNASSAAFTSSTLANGATVSGSLTWTVGVSPTPDKVDFYVEGALQHTEQSAPYDFAWDTTKVADGTHTLVAKAGAATKTITVTVKNTTAPPTLSSSLADGSTVSGSVSWTATSNASRVDFYVDGNLRKSDGGAPFSYTWDTTVESAGTHTLMLKAGSASLTLTVTVTNAALGVTQNLTDGQVLTGTVDWLATPAGPARKVEFLINGQRVATYRSAPYGGSLDTTKLRNGTYTFAVRAVAPDGTSVTAQITATVQN
jgi:hypothetical protein